MENTVYFQKPIAIEPFVQHFRALIDDAETQTNSPI